MDNLTIIFIIVIFIIAIVAIIIVSKFGFSNILKVFSSSDTVEPFLETPHTLTTDNVILENDIFFPENNTQFDYNYSKLKNGSIQVINTLTNQVIDQVNSKSKIIRFNFANQPITEEKIVLEEFEDYGKFIVEMLNTNMEYKCFSLVSIEPLRKTKCPSQIKYQMLINCAYKHPDDKEIIPIQLALVLLWEKGYSECKNFCEKGEFDLTPDYVEGTTYSYIETLVLKM